MVKVIQKSSKEIIFHNYEDRFFLQLVSSIPLKIEANDIIADCSLADKESADFMLRYSNQSA